MTCPPQVGIRAPDLGQIPASTHVISCVTFYQVSECSVLDSEYQNPFQHKAEILKIFRKHLLSDLFKWMIPGKMRLLLAKDFSCMAQRMGLLCSGNWWSSDCPISPGEVLYRECSIVDVRWLHLFGIRTTLDERSILPLFLFLAQKWCNYLGNFFLMQGEGKNDKY